MAVLVCTCLLDAEGTTVGIDGKGMSASNHARGRKCWLCRNKVEVLHHTAPHLHGVLRYGAFLPSIHPERRIGDYVHATARIANIILDRLESLNLSRLTSVVRNIRNTLSLEASQVSVEDRIGWRPRTPNQIDLTQAKLFMDKLDFHKEIVDCVRQSSLIRVLYKGSEVGLQVPIQVILNLFRRLRVFWQQRTLFTHADIATYTSYASEFGIAWSACGWKSTLWVHWLVEHSPILVKKWRNIACFSSIPTEYRHRTFKLDIKHSFMGNKLTRPRFASRGFAHVLHLHMLDLALLPDTLKNRKRQRS